MRQPICAAFALALWPVPVWKPGQLALATLTAACCALALRLKERRFAACHGARLARQEPRVPYMLP
jgi:hypothetical protein